MDKTHIEPFINNIKNIIWYIYRNFLEIFYPKKCVICGKYGLDLCFRCLQTIEIYKTNICPSCGKISKYCHYCPACKARECPYLIGVIVAASYDSPVIKQIVFHLKYLGFTGLAELAAELIAGRLGHCDIPGDKVIVPVPLHKFRQNTRGFNQSELIARALSKRLQISGGNALIRTRNTHTQVTFSRRERQKNVLDAFVCTDKELVLDKTVLLVDDVTTTGSTLNECAKALKFAGAKKVYGVVLGRNI